MIDIILYVVVGLLAGSVSASLGVGGGIIFVPALVVLFGFDQHLAQGTSLAVIVPTAIVGAWVHARAGRVVWRLAVPIGLFGIVGGLIGARVALWIDADVLQRLFAVFLLLTAFRMLRRTRKSAHTAPTPPAEEDGAQA